MITLKGLWADQEVLDWERSLKLPMPLVVRCRYTHALYIHVATQTIVLLSQNESVGPNSVVVDCPQFDPDWEGVGLVMNGRIVIGSRAIGLEEAQPYHASLAQVSRWNSSALRQLVKTVWPQDDVLGHVPERGVRRRLEGHVRMLLSGLERNDKNMVRQGLTALIGLGPGSTPAGDDILVGLLVGLTIFQPIWANRIRESMPTPRELETLTTLASAVELLAAVNGRVFSLMNDLVRWLESPQFGDMSCVKRLVQRGHTSGRDMLAGLVMGARAVSQDSARG